MASRTRQSELSDNQLLLQIGPVVGVDNTTDPFLLDEQSRPINASVVDMSNFVPNRTYGSLTTGQGRTAALASAIPNCSQVLAITRFFTGTGTPKLLFAIKTTGNQLAVYKAVPAGAPALLFSIGTGGLPPTRARFEIYQNNCYLSYGPTNGGFSGTGPLRIDTSLVQNNWQIGAPLNVLVFPVQTGGGNLTGDYYWRYTFSSAEQESSPTDFLGAVTFAGQFAALTLPTASADPQVLHINIYRMGGSSSSWLQVAQVANGTATFNDNVADNKIGNGTPLGNTGQTLVVHRDVPPSFRDMEIFQERLWGWTDSVDNGGIPPGTPSSQSSLWQSNQFESWGFDNVDNIEPISDNPGSANTNPPGDVGIALAKVGGMMVAFKLKSTWAVIGSSPEDTTYQRLFDIGCISTTAVTKGGGGLVFWLSKQGGFSFDGTDAPSETTKDIKTFIDSLAVADFQAAVGFFRDQIWYLSFPNQGVTWGYLLKTQKWHKLPYALDAVYFDAETFEVFGSVPGTGTINSWFQAETDLGNPIVSTLTSKIEDSGNPEFAKDYNFLLIEAPVQTGTLSVTIAPDPGRAGGPASTTLNVDLSLGPRQLLSLPSTMVGTSVQLSLSMTSSAKTTISKVRLYGTIKREFIGVGPG